MANSGPNTSLGGMHDILFQQLERLANEDLKGDDLESEMQRADAICKVTGQIIENGNLALKVAKYRENSVMMAPDIDYLVDEPNRQRITDGKKVDRRGN